MKAENAQKVFGSCVGMSHEQPPHPCSAPKEYQGKGITLYVIVFITYCFIDCIVVLFLSYLKLCWDENMKTT
jgi:hypothetical protein